MELISTIFTIALCAFTIGYVIGGETEYKKNLASKEPGLARENDGTWKVIECPFERTYTSRTQARVHARLHRKYRPETNLPGEVA